MCSMNESQLERANVKKDLSDCVVASMMTRKYMTTPAKYYGKYYAEFPLIPSEVDCIVSEELDFILWRRQSDKIQLISRGKLVC